MFGPSQIGPVDVSEVAEEDRETVSGLGSSLAPQFEVPTTYQQTRTADGFLEATPVQYPWYELDQADKEPQATSPHTVPPRQRDWRSFSMGPRISSIRGEYTVIIPDSDGFGLIATDLSMPIETRPNSGVYIRPRFNWTFLSDPDGADLPNNLFAVSLRAEFWVPRGDYWLFQFFVEPSLYTDFENVGSDAFRLPGQAIAFYQYTPAWQLAAGIVYLDRDDVTIFPAAGLVYKPHDRLRVDVLFPRPKIAWQYGHDPCVEKWFYLLGEFGGSSWAVSRPVGDDVLTYRDIRLLFGMEHKRKDAFAWWFEAGLAVGREIEFESGLGDFDADPSLLGRVAIKF